MPRGGTLDPALTSSSSDGNKFIGYSATTNKSYVITTDSNGGIVSAYDNDTDTLLTGTNIPADLKFGGEPGAGGLSPRWVTITDQANTDFGKTFAVLEDISGTTATYKYATGVDKGKAYAPPLTGVSIGLSPVELTIESRSLASSTAISVGATFSGIPTYPAHGQGCIVEVGTNGTAPIIGVIIRNTELPISNPLLPPILPGITKATYIKTNLSDSPMPVGTVFNLATRSDAVAVQFRQLSDAEISGLLIGSPPSQILPQSTAVPFTPVQTIIPAGLTLPAVGAKVTVAVNPIANLATNKAFIVGDIVIVTESKTDQSTAKIAWFAVDSVTGDSITLTSIARSQSSAAGAIFPAGGATEITGQTRLPIPSVLVSVATIKATANYIHVTDALYSQSTGYKVAKSLYDIQPVAYWCIKNTGLPDLDINTRMGTEIHINSSIKLDNRTDLENFRLISAAPIRYLPAFEVLFS